MQRILKHGDIQNTILTPADKELNVLIVYIERLHTSSPWLYLSDFLLEGGEFRLAMTDRATIANMEVAKLVPWNSLLNYYRPRRSL